MSIAEFMLFVGLVCNTSAPTTQVPSAVKEDCILYYTNCAVKADGKIDRLTVSDCNLKAKAVSQKWGRDE